MNRKDFLSLLGIGAAAACAQCLTGCKNDLVNPPTNVDFTLDLTASVNAPLNANGGFIYRDGVIVARTVAWRYVAVSQACTHQGNDVVYDAGSNEFHCPAHGSNFATNGAVINGPADTGLMQYNTKLTGTSLRVYS